MYLNNLCVCLEHGPCKGISDIGKTLLKYHTEKLTLRTIDCSV